MMSLPLCLLQGLLMGAPAPPLDSLEFVSREPTPVETHLHGMGILKTARWEESPLSGEALLLVGLGSGKSSTAHRPWAAALARADLDRGLRVLALGTHATALEGWPTAAAIAPADSVWTDAAVEGRITVISRTGVLVYGGEDQEEASLKLHIVLRWPAAPSPLHPPAPLLEEAWARYNDGQWADARRLAEALGASLDPKVTSGADLAGLVDAHERALTERLKALPSSPALHELVALGRLREELMRGFPGSEATSTLLTWTRAQRSAEGGRARLRLASDWLALEPRRPLGWPLLSKDSPMTGAFEALNERLPREEPLAVLGQLLLELTD